MQAAKNIIQKDLAILSDSNFWEQFHYDFQLHTGHIDDLSDWTQTAMLALHSQLLLNNEYQRALVRAENEIIINHNLVIPLFENNMIRANLIAIKQERCLPMHDHPNSSGAMMVISGSVHATVCEQEIPANGNQPSNILTIVTNKHFSTNETSCFTQDRFNIHGIKALTNRAVLMVIHTPPFTADQQTFFFTANPQQEVGSQVLVQRVRAHAVQKIRQNNQHNDNSRLAK